MTKIHKQKSGLCRWGCGRKTPNHTGICDGCWKGKSALFIARKREEAKKPKKAISEATRAGLKAYKKDVSDAKMVIQATLGQKT